MSSSSSSAIAGPSQTQVETNSRGIPHAPFISNVQEYLGGPDEDVEPTLKKFQETMSKYKFMELNTAQRRRGLEEKIPDIKKTLQMVQYLKEQKEDPESEAIETTFELNDTLYAKAKLDPVVNVHLWLGANVMLEYPIEEAISLLTNKLSSAEKSLTASKEDLDFLREQITIMEVNTARVHNWDVKRRRERREQLERSGLGVDDEESAKAKTSTWLSSDRDREVVSTKGTVGPAPQYVDPASSDPGSLATSTNVAEKPDTQPEEARVDSSAGTEPRTVSEETEGGQVPQARPLSQDQQPSLPVATGQAPNSSPSQSHQQAQTSSHEPQGYVSGFQASSSHTAASVVDTSGTNANSAADLLSSTAIIVPPLNFNMVSKGIYRSGHPNERNFEFLKRLNLKSIMYLGNEDYRSNMVGWANSQGIRIFHFRLAINKEPMAEMDGDDVSKALQAILQGQNLPILIHCNKGKYRVGCLVGLLRRLQGWSHTSIFEEYSRFAGTKISDLEYIEVFDLSKISLKQ